MSKLRTLFAATSVAFSVFVFSSISAPVMAADGHIADDVQIIYHTGPSTRYRIAGRVSSGDPVEILQTNATTKFIQIKMANGKTGWVGPSSVDTGASKLTLIPKLETELTENKEMVTKQRLVISNLRNDQQITEEARVKLMDEVGQLKGELKELKFELEMKDESTQIRWFTNGALIAMGGVILGLIGSNLSKRKRQTSSW